MLEVKINKSKLISPEGDRLYIKDVTGSEGDVSYVLNEDTQTYDEVVNSTGYGATNGERETVANFPVGILKLSEGDEFVDFEPYNPTTAMEFAAIMTKDSRIMTYIISVPAVANPLPTAYASEKCVYDTVTMTLLQKNGSALVEVEPEDLVNTDYATEPHDALFIAFNSLKKGKLMRELVDAMKAVNCSKDVKLLRYDYDVVSTILTGAAYEFWVGNRLLAQKDIEFLNSYNYSC
jgi:hypothetical protein